MPSPPEVVRARQEAVVELRPRLDLREDLALLGEGIHTGSEAQALTHWAAAPPVGHFERHSLGRKGPSPVRIVDRGALDRGVQLAGISSQRLSRGRSSHSVCGSR